MWVSDITNTTVAVGASSAFSTLIGADWERGSSNSELATIMRQVGILHVVAEDATPAVGTTRFGIIATVQDEDTGATGVFGAGTVDDERAMWTYMTMIRKDSATATNTPDYGVSTQVDIKAKRKITNGQTLDWQIQGDAVNGTGAILRVGWMIRTLVKVG